MNKENELGTKSVGKLLLSLSIPAIAAQLINVLYNMVDRMYIGHIDNIGTLALTGVGVCMPIIVAVSAFAYLVSMGGAPRASIFMGRKDNDTAEKILGNSFFSLLIISISLTILLLVFGEPLLLSFGANKQTLPYALEYLNIYAIGTIFVQMSLGLNAFITSQGFAKTSMYTVLIGAIINIVLDPILIFGFDMGVSGAALATIISQGVSCIWVLRFLIGKKTILKIKKINIHFNPKIMLPTLALGLSPFVMQISESIITICFNSQLLQHGGTIAVGSMTILASVMQFSLLPLMGLTQGSQPIISYNYGANNPERMKKAFKYLIISAAIYTAIIWVISMFVPKLFILIFTNDPELIAFTTNAIRIYMFGILLFGAQIACQQTFIALGEAKSSIALAVLRKIIILTPLIYLLPAFLTNKTNAIFLAEPIADITAVIVTLSIFRLKFNKLLNTMNNNR